MVGQTLQCRGVYRFRRAYGIELQIARKTSKHRFEVLPVRWIVERGHAWVGRDRINAKEREHTPNASLNFSAAHGNRSKFDGGATDADGHTLAIFAAGPNPVAYGGIVA